MHFMASHLVNDLHNRIVEKGDGISRLLFIYKCHLCNSSLRVAKALFCSRTCA